MNVTARFESAEAIPGLCTLAFTKPLARATLAAFTIAGPAPGAAVAAKLVMGSSGRGCVTTTGFDSVAVKGLETISTTSPTIGTLLQP